MNQDWTTVVPQPLAAMSLWSWLSRTAWASLPATRPEFDLPFVRKALFTRTLIDLYVSGDTLRTPSRIREPRLAEAARMASMSSFRRNSWGTEPKEPSSSNIRWTISASSFEPASGSATGLAPWGENPWKRTPAEKTAANTAIAVTGMRLWNIHAAPSPTAITIHGNHRPCRKNTSMMQRNRSTVSIVRSRGDFQEARLKTVPASRPASRLQPLSSESGVYPRSQA